MKLAELYSLVTGLEIGDQDFLSDFFPLPFKKYIVIHAGSGMQAKNYPFYQEVIDLINPILDRQGIKIVQVGIDKEEVLSGCTRLNGQTTKRQANYVLSRSMLLVGNDSWFAHRAGELGLPLVTCFGPTSIENHSAYHYNKEKTIFLESHRLGRNPSFASQEMPQSIALIPPEQIANAILSLLDLPLIDRQSLYIGPNYKQFILEVVPNTLLPANFYPDHPITLRFDYHFNENILVPSNRKIHIVTDKPIDINKLQSLRPNVLGVNYEVKFETDLEYLKKLRYSGIKTLFYSKEKDEKKLADIRFKFFDVGIIEKFTETTRENFIKGTETYLNKKLDNLPAFDTLKYRSNKFLFSDGHAYLSKADWKAGKTIELNNPVSVPIDSPDFFEELNHFYIWKE